MGSEWPVVPLVEAAQVFTGFAFKGDEYLPAGTGVRVVRGDNVTEHSLRWAEKEKCWPSVTKELESFLLREGDVVVGMDGSKVGKNFAAVSRTDGVCLLAQRVARIRAKPHFDQTFLRYAVCNTSFTDYVRAVHTGTSIPHISKGQIERFLVCVPPLVHQAAIGAVLSALDDRIALLRETNATLEAIAQALFKSWFVDFDPVRAKQQGVAPVGMDEATAASFPDSFEHSASGLLPRGWRLEPIGQVVEGIYDGPHATPPEADEGPVFLGIKNLTGSGLDFAEVRHIAEADFAQWTRRVEPQAGDIVFSYEATLGYFALIPPGLRCCLGRRLALVRPRGGGADGHFLFHQFVAAPFQRLLQRHTIQGATVNRIALKQFPTYPVLNPPVELKATFDSAVRPLWARIHENQAQVQTLATLRDTLLPRLISGQLRLPEVEAAPETA